MAVRNTGNRTALFSRSQPGGVFSIQDMSQHPADIWFVDSNNASGYDGVGYGKNPDRPFLTWDYAIGRCTASKGDVIYLMPGHAEVVAAASGVALDVIGVTTIGLGNGTLQPTVTLTTANTATVAVSAASVTVENVHFVANFLDIATAIVLSADDVTFRKCRFTEYGTNLNAKIWIQDGALLTSDRITIEDCYALALDTDNTHFLNLAGTGDGHIIRRNVLIGDWGTVAVGGAGIVTNILIADNYIYNFSASNDAIIALAATVTGIVVNNSTGGTAAAANGITATACIKNNNYYADLPGGDVQGILDPVIT